MILAPFFFALLLFAHAIDAAAVRAGGVRQHLGRRGTKNRP